MPISAGGGASPVWSRDGRTIYYAGRSGAMAVSLGKCATRVSGPRFAHADQVCPEPTPSTPVEIVHGPWIPRGTTPTGRLLVERARGRLAGVDRVSVTLQWTRELQRLLPAAVVSSPK